MFIKMGHFVPLQYVQKYVQSCLSTFNKKVLTSPQIWEWPRFSLCFGVSLLCELMWESDPNYVILGPPKSFPCMLLFSCNVFSNLSYWTLESYLEDFVPILTKCLLLHSIWSHFWDCYWQMWLDATCVFTHLDDENVNSSNVTIRYHFPPTRWGEKVYIVREDSDNVYPLHHW